MKPIILKFGLLAGLLLLLLELSRYAISTKAYYQDFLIVVSAVALIAFGFTLANHLTSKKRVLIDENIPDKDKLKLLNISKREYEVLQNIAEGYSNTQIANQLFVSESTIKTHVSNLLSKLAAKRRTEAVKHAKEYGIL